MKHASAETLLLLVPLLDQIRTLAEVKEKKTGVFYRKSRAFLHFHEDSGEIYADVRLGGSDFSRFPCTTENEQHILFSAIVKVLN